MGKRTGKVKVPADVRYERAVTEMAGLRVSILGAAETHQDLAQRAAEAGAALKALRDREKQLQRIVDKGPPPVETHREVIENPLRADGLVAAELAADAGPAGMIEVSVNMATRIGGLARVKGLTQEQVLAAARFRSVWMDAQIGGARAIDYSVPRVDTSGGSADGMSGNGYDSLLAYSRVVQALGPLKANLVQRVVCEDMSLRALGRMLGRGDGGRDRVSLSDELLGAVDDVARHFGMGPARPRGGIRSEGERAQWVAGGIADQSSVDVADEAA